MAKEKMVIALYTEITGITLDGVVYWRLLWGYKFSKEIALLYAAFLFEYLNIGPDITLFIREETFLRALIFLILIIKLLKLTN